MKKIINIRILALLSLIISMGLVSSSCKKDSASPSTVELLSFGPAGAQIGDTISIIGNNLDMVTAVKFTGGDSISKTSFIQQNSELIKVKVPEHAQRGTITLTTPEGNIISKALIDFGIVATVDKSFLTTFLTTTTVRPGDVITITGTHLNYVYEILFNNVSVKQSAFLSQSLTEIKVAVPKNAKTGQITFNYAGTKASSITTDNNLMVKLPSIATFTPNPIYSGTNLTITGSDLDLTMGILFNGISDTIKNFVSQSATQIVVAVPNATLQGTVQLVAYSKVPVSTASNLVIKLPAISALTPNPVSRGSNLTITGTDLNLVSGVMFNGVANPITSFVSKSSTQLVVTVPTGAVKGKIKLVAAYSNVQVPSNDVLKFVGDPASPDPLGYIIYEDNFQNGWQNWGWGSDYDLANTDNVYTENKSIKATYKGSWGALSLNAGSVSSSTYSTFSFSVFGGTGTGGKTFNVSINQGTAIYTATIAEGQWKEINIPLTSLGSPATITRIDVQETAWSGSVYFDHIGLK